jgi:hypothetical protein
MYTVYNRNKVKQEYRDTVSRKNHDSDYPDEDR